MSLSNLPFVPLIERSLKRASAKCSLEPCENKQFMRGIPGAGQGIQVGRLWYCSVECFIQAAFAFFDRTTSRRVFEFPRSPRLSLGLALLSKGFLTPEQLRWATEQSQWREESLDATLVASGLATEKQLAIARSAQWGYPVLAQELGGHIVQADIPLPLLHAYSAVPLHFSLAAKRILLGFVYCVEHSLLESVEHVTGCRVEPCFITSADAAEQMVRLTCSPDYHEILVDDVVSAGKMARAVGQLAEDRAAREASFTHCKNHVWVRLAGKRGIADVVFDLKNALPEALPAEDDRDELAAALG